jgi:diguanylate cyclase (GGDEF)-like protein
MKQWEERALLREQEDPRRRASVMGRLIEGLATQVPVLLGVLALLFLAAGLWHLVVPGEAGREVTLSTVTILVAALCGLEAFRTRGGNMAPERAHITAFAVALAATAVAFTHLVVTEDPAHSIGFVVILMAAGAFFQDGLRLAVAGFIVVMAWLVGFLIANPPPSTWPPVVMGILAATVMTALISTHRIRSLRRLESLNLELQDQIGFDPLTGIANRRAFHERLESLWERLSGEGAPLALILVDLDHFKNLNDTRGHGEGDAALRQVGGVLRMAVRSTEDLPARLGGEEFAVLLPRTKEEHALLVAERIRDAVSYTRIPNPGTANGETLTASLGVALAWPMDGGDAADLMTRADRALYKAKEGGRNQVVVDDGRAPPPPTHPFQSELERSIPEFRIDDGELPPETDDPFHPRRVSVPDTSGAPGRER